MKTNNYLLLQVAARIDIPQSACDWISMMALQLSDTGPSSLTQIADDIWFASSSVTRHSDSTKHGHDTIVCFLDVTGDHTFKQWVSLDKKDEFEFSNKKVIKSIITSILIKIFYIFLR